MKKINWKTLIFCIVIPLLVGAISGFISMNGIKEFASINKPPLTPPGFLFPIVWTILYILMGIASYLVLKSDASQNDKRNALIIYGIQLFFNFFGAFSFSILSFISSRFSGFWRYGY